MDTQQIKSDLSRILDELLPQFERYQTTNNLFVLGCSSSEVLGHRIGKHTSEEVGAVIVETILEKLKDTPYHLCVQGCEHINRSLAIEREVAEANNYPIVNVVPALNAGGAAAVAAYKQFKDPVNVEHVSAQCGIDIGDTSIGMHVRHVQVPVRPELKSLGEAHVTALASRPKYIGGPRAQYQLIEK